MSPHVYQPMGLNQPKPEEKIMINNGPITKVGRQMPIIAVDMGT